MSTARDGSLLAVGTFAGIVAIGAAIAFLLLDFFASHPPQLTTDRMVGGGAPSAWVPVLVLGLPLAAVVVVVAWVYAQTP